MPYITSDKREILAPAINDLFTALREIESDDPTANVEGCVNYVFSTVLARMYPGTTYRNVNDAMGILNSVQSEYYRRVAAPLENQKAFENGDVYDV